MRTPPRSLALLAVSITFAVTATTACITAGAGDWPQWRGPLRNGHATPDESLPATLPESLSPRWRIPVGGGFASPVIAGGRLFVITEQARQETVHALDPLTGKELWKVAYAPAGGDEWGSGPRCTPLADDGRLYVQSMRGEFACLDQSDGRRLWGFNFERDYGVKFLGGNDGSGAASRRRGHAGAPVILRDRIYIAVGATNGGTVVCFDKKSGREIWRGGEDETAYAPLHMGTLAGREQLVAYTAASLAGFDAERGNLLWRVPLRTAASRHASTPIQLGDDLVVSSHSIGLRQFRIRADGTGVEAAEGWAAGDLKTSIATMVEVGGHLYGQGPDRNFLCVDAATGATKWSTPGFGEKPLVGYSAAIAAGRRLLVLTDDGQLVLVAANPERYEELGRVQVCGPTWNHPALAQGRVYLRDRRELLAFDLTSSGDSSPGLP